MIDVLITSDGNDIATISIKGHAEYASEGQDIYCAAVSAVWQCGLTCLDDDCYELSSKKGDSSLNILGKTSQHDTIVLEVIVRSLKELSQNFPEYVRVREETK